MRLIDADHLIERMKSDPLYDVVRPYGVVDVVEHEPTVTDKLPRENRNGGETETLVILKAIPFLSDEDFKNVSMHAKEQGIKGVMFLSNTVDVVAICRDDKVYWNPKLGKEAK